MINRFIWTESRTVRTWNHSDYDCRAVVQEQRKCYFLGIWYWTIVDSERPETVFDILQNIKYVSGIGWPLFRS